jgi:6-phosphogluconolactonase/glucosamine-6-phosphate isomerase/deaminase
MQKFEHEPAFWIPFKDMEVLKRVREIGPDEITSHPNPDFKITLVEDDELEFIFISDMFYRIKKAADENRKVVMILPNPAPAYIKLAHLINKFGVDCSHVHTFNMDEWADEEGNVADENYPQGFLNSTLRFLYNKIDPKLRMPRENIIAPTTKNISYYSKMIEDAGGADICYSGPGWAGHIAFIDPNSPELLSESLDQWKTYGARIVSLHPLTIAQNSLHGCFGASGDIAAVPPKAATIGPADVIASKNRMEMHGLTTAGTYVSWQRLISKLVLHGPVTPLVPSSLLQTLATDVYVTKTLAQKVEPIWSMQY